MLIGACNSNPTSWPIRIFRAETLINNWRVVPGVGQGVLPSYNGYDSGMWSWDTCKQRHRCQTAVRWQARMDPSSLLLLSAPGPVCLVCVGGGRKRR